ncbi:MAG: hypothetical protein HW386_170 [Gammaproteobacteria bacterium]|nr:hypothetical protein [Gammaproteobacteria bacterium]
MRAKYLLLLASVLMIGSCSTNQTSAGKPHEKKKEVLVIYADGTMMLNGRTMNKEDVVIYPDGYGGERAAVRVFVAPLHPDFFRDTIPVDRIDVEVERSDD